MDPGDDELVEELDEGQDLHLMTHDLKGALGDGFLSENIDRDHAHA